MKLAGLMEDSGDWDLHFLGMKWIQTSGKMARDTVSGLILISGRVFEFVLSILEACTAYDVNSFDLTVRVELQSRNSRLYRAMKPALPFIVTCFKHKVRSSAPCCR